MAVSEVDSKLVHKRCFGQDEHTILDFRKSMAMEPINNPYVVEESKRKLQNRQGKESNLHNLVRLPINRAFSKSKNSPDAKPSLSSCDAPVDMQSAEVLHLQSRDHEMQRLFLFTQTGTPERRKGMN